MKRNQSKFILGGMVVALTMLTACGNDHEYSVKENQAYIAQTNTNGNASQKLTVDDQPVSVSLNVRLSSPTSEDCSFEVVADESVLTEYNNLNVTSYRMLPEDFFSFSSDVITVEKDNSLSSPINVNVSPMSEELKATGLKYAIGIRLVSKDGKKDVLASGSKYVIVLDQVPKQAVPLFNRNLMSILPVPQLTLTEYTVEMCVNMDILGTRIGQYNNQGLFYAGGDGEIFLRFGDAPIEGNRFQVKTMGTQMNSNMLFNANTWYHIAVVCTGTNLYFYFNGVLDNSLDLPNNPMTLGPNFSVITSGSYFVAQKAKMCQVRFWSKARSQMEIANNMYNVDPTSSGLEGYWKMDEGEGNVFKDSSPHGRDAYLNNSGLNVTWEQDVRIDGK